MQSYLEERSEHLKTESNRIASELEVIRKRIASLSNEEQSLLTDLKIVETRTDEIDRALKRQIADSQASQQQSDKKPDQNTGTEDASTVLTVHSISEKWTRILRQLPTDKKEAMSIQDLTRHLNSIGITMSEHTVYQRLMDFLNTGITGRITFSGNRPHLWYRIDNVLKLHHSAAQKIARTQ